MSRRLTPQERIWRTVPEADVLRAVLDYAHRLSGYAWRTNTGAVRAEYYGKSRYVRFGEPGCSDLTAVIPRPGGGGVVLFIETKDETGRQSDEQKSWQASIEAAGGTYVLARPSNWQEAIDAALGVLAEAKETGNG